MYLPIPNYAAFILTGTVGTRSCIGLFTHYMRYYWLTCVHVPALPSGFACTSALHSFTVNSNTVLSILVHCIHVHSSPGSLTYCRHFGVQWNSIWVEWNCGAFFDQCYMYKLASIMYVCMYSRYDTQSCYLHVHIHYSCTFCPIMVAHNWHCHLMFVEVVFYHWIWKQFESPLLTDCYQRSCITSVPSWVPPIVYSIITVKFCH